MTELWRTSWRGNPATKKNTPLPLMFCLGGDGKKRQVGAFLDRLLDLAQRNGAQWDVIVSAAMENGPPSLDRLLWLAQLIGVARPEPARQLLADLQAVTGDGGRQIIILPEETYRKALKEVVPQLRMEWGERPALGGKDQPLAVEAHFYLGPKQRPDLLSLCEAVSDLLQVAGVIVNDSWIASWDGTRRHKDQRGNPRTEIVIREFTAAGAAVSSRGLGSDSAPGSFSPAGQLILETVSEPAESTISARAVSRQGQERDRAAACR